ncbi:MAG: hypothetical protein AB7Q81_14415 [Gammaproteobacteria bacterium]
MPRPNRYTVLRWHALIACFFLPLALLVFVSGTLYTAGIKGGVEKETLDVALDQPFHPDLDWLDGVARDALAAAGLAAPHGTTTLTRRRGDYRYTWGDRAHHVTLVAGPSPERAELTWRERSALTQVMRIHRAESGAPFAVLTGVLGGGLVVVLVTGCWLALGLPRLKRQALAAVAAGSALVAVLAVTV